MDAQSRAYDFLESLYDAGNSLSVPKESAEGYCSVYESCREAVEKAYDRDSLLKEAESRLQPFIDAMNESRYEAAAAASLHEFVKEVFDTWQTAGVFARRRALRELRRRAGFRLESHRIGNYVAKTFDLMNQAQLSFAKAQQAVFANDMSYKCKDGIYKEIYAVLKQML